MPLPAFTLCASDLIQDKDTNQLSIFNVIGKVTVRKFRPDQPKPVGELADNEMPFGMGVMKVVAVWSKLDGEDGVELEHEFRVLYGDTDDRAGGEPFVFNERLSYYRFFLAMRGFPFNDGSDVVIIRSRVRRKGEDQWVSQDCRILVEVIEPKPLEEKAHELLEA